jgi:hypothetical protein
MFNKMDSSREIASKRRTIGICSVFSRRFPGIGTTGGSFFPDNKKLPRVGEFFIVGISSFLS